MERMIKWGIFKPRKGKKKMAEYILSESIIPDQLSARIYADTATGLPTRVEIRGRTGQYKFILSSPDRTREFRVDFDSDVTVSRTISNAVASRYVSGWEMRVEGA